MNKVRQQSLTYDKFLKLTIFNFMMWKQYTFSGYHMNNDLHFTDEDLKQELITCPNSSANNQLIRPVFKHQKPHIEA